MARFRLVWMFVAILLALPLSPHGVEAAKDQTYVSTGLRFSLRWDRSWQLVDQQSDVLSESFTLSNGTSTVRFRALLGFGGDSQACLDYVDSEFREESDADIVGEIGGGLTEPLSGDATTAAFSVYRVTLLENRQRPALLYLDCQTLVPGESVLVGNVVSPGSEWAGERRDLRKLWRSITVFPPPIPGRSGGEPPLQTIATWFAADLQRFWDAAFDGVDRPYRAPSYDVFDDSASSQCGELWPGAAALYCGYDDGVYLDQRWIGLNVLPDYGASGVAYLMGHETAHGVQFQQGTVSFSRRQELQADCLAGAYMRSLVDAEVFTAATVRGLEPLVRAGGDDAISNLSGATTYSESHGTGQQRWTLFRRGSEVGVAGCGLELAEAD